MPRSHWARAGMFGRALIIGVLVLGLGACSGVNKTDSTATLQDVDVTPAILAEGETAVVEVLVTNADCPLLTAADLEPLFGNGKLTMLAFEPADPAHYGRMIQDADGRLLRIVEARDATPEELAVRSCYSGMLACPAGLLFDWLAQIDNDNVKAEYYITGIVEKSRSHPAIALGASPRASIGLLAASRAQALLRGRDFVVPDDVKSHAHAVLRHRLVLQPDAELEGTSPDVCIDNILHEVPVPKTAA